MTALECMFIGIIMVLLGFMFGITGSLVAKKLSTQDAFFDFGGYLVGAGAIIASLAWIYYIGTLILS